jgi:hypothetical protein
MAIGVMPNALMFDLREALPWRWLLFSSTRRQSIGVVQRGPAGTMDKQQAAGEPGSLINREQSELIVRRCRSLNTVWVHALPRSEPV